MPADSPARVVLVTGSAKRLGREIALDLARAGWQVAIHYRDSLEEANRTSAECARLSGKSAVFRTNLANEMAVQNLLPSVMSAFRPGRCRRQQRLDVRTRQRRQTSALPPWRNTCAAMPARPSCWRRRCMLHIGQRRAGALGDDDAHRQAQGAVVNLLDQKLWNQNPDFLSYTLSKAALEAATTMLALALAPHVRVVGVAPGLTLTSPMLSDDAVQGAAQAGPAGAILDAGRRGGHRAFCAGQPIHHRHLAAGGRWPAPDAIFARLLADVTPPRIPLP